jgi:hypothetical protein
MKKTLIFTILILVTSGFIYGQDFRKSNWGMNKAQVKKTETSEILKETDDVLAYKSELAGYQSYVIYIFAGDKLTRAKYSIIEEHSNKNDYISDYNTLKSLLQKKYGVPKEDETIWKNDLYKDDYSQWGFAVSLGHLTYYSSWETERTSVFFVLNGENYDLETVIEYSSKELSAVEDKMRDDVALSNFSDIGFRTSKWGSTISEVKTNEKLEVIDESSSLLAYETTISGSKTMIGYLFTEGKLTTGRYLATEEHSNKNDYINDYNTLKNLLEKKYGKPKEDEKIWKNDLYQDDYSQWGFAVSLGHLLYYSTWETENSEISVMLSGENYKIQLIIDFDSVEFKEFKEKANEKKNLDDF